MNEEGEAAHRGRLFVFSAPSGAGKHTILGRLLERDPRLAYVTTTTTRAPRPGEVHGRDYFFVSQEDFLRTRDTGELLEWAEVHGALYGTPKAELERVLQTGQDAVLQVDVQGRRNIEANGVPHASVFIMPPSLEELEVRLRSRGADSDEVIDLRLRNAETELAARNEYDFVVVNDNVEDAVARCEAIIRTCRARDAEEHTNR